MDDFNLDSEEIEDQDSSIVTLVDENGNDVRFDILDVITYEGETYAIMDPIDDHGEDEDVEVVILHMVPVDDDFDMEGVEDEKLLDTLFELFQANNPDLFDN